MKLRLVVVSTVRDVSKTIYKDIKILRRALSHLFDIQFLFVESDSTDNTLSILQQLSLKDPTIRVISHGKLSSRFPDREARLAFCRNTYMHEIDNYYAYQHIPYVFVADCDGINTHLTPSSIQTCFNSGRTWDACFPNSKGPYYDLYALRHPTWNPSCPRTQIDFYRSINTNIHTVYNLVLYSRMITIPVSSDWIRVTSAFGGCAFYRLEAIRGKRYRAFEDNNPVCEHVPFNEDLALAGYSLYINPSFVNTHLNMHNIPSTFPYRYLLAIRRTLRSYLSSLKSKYFN